MTVYDLKPMQAPRTAGLLLKVLTQVLEHPLTGPFLAEKLFADAGITVVREVACDTPLPDHHPLLAMDLPTLAADSSAPFEFLATDATPGDAYESAGDYALAYREGKTNPEAVALRIIELTRAQMPGARAMRALILQDEADVLAQARASRTRIASGQLRGPLDGVPVAVKDELDMPPYPTHAGTRFMGKAPAKADAEVVARLRAAGALLVGKTNMHEIGMGTTGLNPHFGSARNPYDLDRGAGGSSGGSAAAVAAGLVPLALGADAGGSIRIPAGLCGVVGLKPTFGRISGRGAAPLCWSVGHVGALGATARDVALAYMLMAGPDAGDSRTRRQPRPHLADFSARDLKGVRLGIYRPWFEDADPDIVSVCSTLLARLVAAGASLVEIEIPELGVMAAAHVVTIAAEMAASNLPFDATNRKDYSYEIRFNLALARRLRGHDYVLAQRLRPRMLDHFMRAFTQVDMIVTPTAGCSAPILKADALVTGDSDIMLLDRLMRFARPANFTGLPAISFPAGYDLSGLPVGLQAMGRPWEEHLLLRLARIAEGLVERKAPTLHRRVLSQTPT